MRHSSRQISRRAFVSATLLPLAAARCAPSLRVGLPNVSAIPQIEPSTLVNDVHSQMNATHVAGIVKPLTTEVLQAAVRAAAETGRAVAVAGGRHAMGGQQFAEDALLVDTRDLNRARIRRGRGRHHRRGRHGGSYYQTYHRWARRDQVERCYPQLRAFLALTPARS